MQQNGEYQSINQRYIRVFLKIAETGSISAASRALHFTQPTISYCLAQLEKEVGFPLVTRRQGVRQAALTPQGKAFVPLAQKLLDAQEEVSRFVQSQTPNILRVCSNNTLHGVLLPDICNRFMAQNRDVDLRLGVWTDCTIHDALTRYLHDIGICNGIYEGSDSIRSVPLYDSGFCLLCPADTPLPKRTISLRELDPRYAVIPGSYLQENAETLAKNQAFLTWYHRYISEAVQPWFKPAQMLTIGEYLTDRRCWAPIPEDSAHYLAKRHHGELVIRELDTIPHRVSCSVLISKTYADQALADQFLECCASVVAEQPWLRSLLK